MKHFVKTLLVAALALTLLFTASCSLFAEEPKTFTSGEVSITLTNRFNEVENENFTVTYASSKVAVVLLKETYTDLAAAGLTAASTAADYAEVVIEVQNLTGSTVSVENGLTCFTYESTVDGVTYRYLSTVHKTDDAFWMVQFGCDTDDFDANKADFVTYAKSVSFS